MKHTSREEKRQALMTGKVVSVKPLANKLKRDAAVRAHDLSSMARECTEQLKPFGKTIKDATDFYLRHLTRKKSTGRPRGSGVLSGITPSMEWSDIRNRTATDRFKTKVIYLLEMAMWRTPAKPTHDRPA